MIANKRILFITDSCPPNLTMGGIVVKNIIDYLIDYNHVDIIAVRQDDNDVAFYKNTKVDYIESAAYHILKNRRKKHEAENVIALWYGFIEFIFRVFSLLSRIISSLGINIQLRNRIKSKANKKIQSNTYDYVFCNAKPFEAFDAVYSIIKASPDACFIAYQTDDFVSADVERYIPGFIQKRKKNNRIKRINDYVNSFNVYGVLESVYRKEIGYIINKNKVKSLGIPLLIENSCNSENRNSKDTYHFVYAGSLVKAFRPPNECLNILLELSRSCDISVDVYHRGDCNDVIQQYEILSNSVIHNKGTVSSDIAYSAIKNADFLISISNVAGDQISGKTFDYISTCKPVIHFYYNESDMNAEVFRRYKKGICICLHKDKLDENVNMLKEFISYSKNISVSFSELLNEFKDYTVNSVVNELFEV